MERFDGIFVINMDKDNERLTSFLKALKKWNPTRFPAVITSNLTPSQKLLKNEYISKLSLMSKNEIGCFLSHLSVWKILNESDMNRIIIFEDDARTMIPLKKVEKLISRLYEHLSKNNLEEPDILFLGKAMDNCSKYKKIIDDVYENFSPVGAHAYIINKTGVKKLLSHKLNLFPTDTTMTHYKENLNLKFMTFHPSLFFQDNMTFASNLRNNASYNLYNECGINMEEVVMHYSETKYFAFASIILMILIIFIIWIVLFFYKKSNVKFIAAQKLPHKKSIMKNLED